MLIPAMVFMVVMSLVDVSLKKVIPPVMSCNAIIYSINILFKRKLTERFSCFNIDDITRLDDLISFFMDHISFSYSLNANLNAP